jgi:hypothetical protein
MAHARTISRPSGSYRARASAPAADEDIDWAAAGWAGLVAGAVYILVESALISLFSGGPNSDAVRRIAAIALGETTLPPSTPFTALVFLSAMAVHLPLSLLYARVLAALVHGFSAPRAAVVGAGFGGLLYAVNFYAFARIFPWFAVARGWMTLSAHVVFGIVAAAAYVLLIERGKE